MPKQWSLVHCKVTVGEYAAHRCVRLPRMLITEGVSNRAMVLFEEGSGRVNEFLTASGRWSRSTVMRIVCSLVRSIPWAFVLVIPRKLRSFSGNPVSPCPIGINVFRSHVSRQQKSPEVCAILYASQLAFGFGARSSAERSVRAFL